MAADERTSKSIATLASEVLKMDDREVLALAMTRPRLIRSLAASALTQARDRAPEDELEGDPPPPEG